MNIIKKDTNIPYVSILLIGKDLFLDYCTTVSTLPN